MVAVEGIAVGQLAGVEVADMRPVGVADGEAECLADPQLGSRGLTGITRRLPEAFRASWRFARVGRS